MRRAHASLEGRGELTLSELCDAMRDCSQVRVVGSGSRQRWLPPWSGATLTVPSGVIEHEVDDQVVQVWAGTEVAELQEQLNKYGQCLPLARGLPDVCSQAHGTVGGLLAMNLPHALSAQCGGPRDWVLGMTIVRTDGSVAKSGSKAVKSVAGYDAHKFFVGSRGTLGAIASVTLRTFPIAATPEHETEVMMSAEATHVARTLRTDFAAAVSSAHGLVAVDRASCTLWTTQEPELPGEGWMIGPMGAMKRRPQPEKFEARARQVFDPSDKLAPGWKV
jgi:glycolate oxidase FAD binding subunit